MVINILIILGVAALVIYLIRDQIKHIKGEGGGCCGKTEKVPKKKLQGRILGRKRLKVSGMHCVNCENHVSFALNAIEGLSTVKASASKGIVLVEFDREVKDEDIRAAVEGEDFQLVSIEDI